VSDRATRNTQAGTMGGAPAPTVKGWVFLPLGFLLLLGLATMIGTARGANPVRAWEIYFVNLLFWSGIAQAGIVLSAVMVITNARWWLPLRRIAEGMASFLPVSFVLFVLLFVAGKQLFPWNQNPAMERSPWLTWHPLEIRDMVAIIVLYGMSFAYLFTSIGRQKRGYADEGPGRTLEVLSPALAVVYAVVYSLLAIDLVMGLSPPWHSTLYGGYFFMGSLYTGLAALAILIVLHRSSPGPEGLIGERHRHDLGKLLFAFCMVAGDFFWSQFLVIWYGNLPAETDYLLRRIESGPWAVLSWGVLVVAFVLPFIILLSQRVKVKSAGLVTVALIVLVGMWFERYVLVVPSVYAGETVPLGWTELAITLGFISLSVSTYLIYLKLIPRLYARTE
jgi:Ni/Fe-hydrogenase subunit HybB-like protein